MNASYFLDTNILVYLFDSTAKDKQIKAQSLFEHSHESKKGFISTQVMQEFVNVASKKFRVPLTFLDLQHFLITGLRPLCKLQTDVSLIIRALRVRDSTGYSFYDSLIIASALQLECTILYSEDLQHDQQVETLRIINPFM